MGLIARVGEKKYHAQGGAGVANGSYRFPGGRYVATETAVWEPPERVKKIGRTKRVIARPESTRESNLC